MTINKKLPTPIQGERVSARWGSKAAVQILELDEALGGNMVIASEPMMIFSRHTFEGLVGVAVPVKDQKSGVGVLWVLEADLRPWSELERGLR